MRSFFHCSLYPVSAIFESILQHVYLPYKNSRIHYLRHDGADKLLICLHGYGEWAESFSVLAKQLEHQYTIIAPDLPFHGATEWNEGLLFEKDDLIAIINLLVGDRDFQLLGYSMGGRIALQLYQLLPTRITRLLLLAPDGLKVNPWYWVATQNAIGNQLFRYFMHKPGLFFKGTALLKKFNLINKGVYNYAMQFLKQEPLRKDLYTIWTTFRRITPSTGKAQQMIRQYGTSTILIYGKNDTIIPYSAGKKFAKACAGNCSVNILPCGHRLLQEKNIAAISNIILHKTDSRNE